MKLYKTPTALAGERWHSAKTGLKDFTEIELPKDGRAGMAQLFNDNEREITSLVLTVGDKIVGVGAGPRLDEPRDPLEEAELRAVAAAQGGLLHYDYKSPFSARTILADIDASSIAKAVSQLHGPALRKVVAAVSDRLSQLAEGIDNGA